jgi:hypothetical protein
MKKIYLISATIRPDVYKDTLKVWLSRASNESAIKIDIIADTPEDQKQIDNCKLYGLPAFGITKPLTKLTLDLVSRVKDDDIIVVMSDDFFPPENWDTYLLGFYKNNTGALSVKVDGLNDGGRSVIVSIPIIDGYTLKKLNGYIYHPAYNHHYSDNELYDNLLFLNLLHIDNNEDAPKFEHKHWTTSGRKRDESDLNNAKYDSIDKKTYTHRKQLNFEERVKHPPLLSILICSLHIRKPKLDILLKKLKKQCKNKNVEIKICGDNGELIISTKRNRLLRNSIGEYVCFIDDDDDISENYIQQIYDGLLTRPDCIGITGEYWRDGKYIKKFVHSIKFKKWGENKDFYERCPNHLNPIKRDHIFNIGGFNESLKSGEDLDFSNRVKKYLKTEVLIESPIYKYLFETTNKNY